MLRSGRWTPIFAIFYLVLMLVLGTSVANSTGGEISESTSRSQSERQDFQQTAFTDNPMETRNISFEDSIEATCVDSDSGLNYELQGFVEGEGPNGFPYNKPDVCESGDYEGYIKEFYCNDTIPWARRYQCPNGCYEGACITEPTVCTDNDEDGYTQEGGACGAVDCDDNNPLVNPGGAEVCGNGIDDNCDGVTDSEDPICQVCTDYDGDGFAVEGSSCGPADCNDSNPLINPGAIEVCDNGIDDNCNGLVDSADPVCRETPNIVVVGWDGTNRDHFWQCYDQEAPECAQGLANIDALAGGMIFNNTTTSGDTATKPGWAQILSGYNAEVTGIFSNGQYQPIPLDYTIFEKIQNHLGPENVVTMFISGKSVNTGGACIGDETIKGGQVVIEDQGQPWCLAKDHLDYYENDLRHNSVVANRAMELLENHSNDLFVAAFIFRTPDVIGHLAGVDSGRYSLALVDNDYWLGQITAKLQELGLSDTTLVYVATDHGFDEGSNRHGNAPYGILASNDPAIVRSGDRKDVAPTILELFGISLGEIGPAPAVDGFSLYSLPPLSCIPEGEAFIDYPGAPACCAGLSVINLDRPIGPNCFPASGTTTDGSGFCTACGNGICESPENKCNCAADCG